MSVNETAGILDARLGVIERIRRIEHLLARSEQARIAATLMKGFSHELGNQVQIVKLAALELARRLAAVERGDGIDGVPVDGVVRVDGMNSVSVDGLERGDGVGADGAVHAFDGASVDGVATPLLTLAGGAAMASGFGSHARAAGSSPSMRGVFTSGFDGASNRRGASGSRAAATHVLQSSSAAAANAPQSGSRAAAHSLQSGGATRSPRLELDELISDMAAAADAATTVLAQMFAVARPSDRDVIGPSVTTAVRAAVDVVRPAIAGSLELRIELDPTVQTYASAEELEAMVLAAVLDAASATHITLVLRERVIQNKRWVELLRFDDRHHLHDGELAQMFEPHSLLHVVAGVAKAAGGDASLAPGRSGIELAVELPVASPTIAAVASR